ncbi:MAG: hypothetical protein V1838_01735 [Patescibacteria group bacterium]
MTKSIKITYSAWGIFFAIIFVGLLVLLGERAWGDFDKYFNPLYSYCHGGIQFSKWIHVEQIGYGCDAAQYEANRLVFHIALVVPLLFIMQMIYYWTARKHLLGHSRIMIRSYFLFLLWMTLHLFFEIALMLFRYYSEFGFYVIVGFIAVIFAFLVVLVQRRHSEKHDKPKDG